jgi:hypothetical protein
MYAFSFRVFVRAALSFRVIISEVMFMRVSWVSLPSRIPKTFFFCNPFPLDSYLRVEYNMSIVEVNVTGKKDTMPTIYKQWRRTKWLYSWKRSNPFSCTGLFGSYGPFGKHGKTGEFLRLYLATRKAVGSPIACRYRISRVSRGVLASVYQAFFGTDFRI